MMVIQPPYPDLPAGKESSCVIIDTMGGFDHSLKCDLLDKLLLRQPLLKRISTEYIANQDLRGSYPEVSINFDIGVWTKENHIKDFYTYRIHPTTDLQYFLCCFNGHSHVSRKLLTAILHRFGYFNNHTCSKNLQFTTASVDGQIEDFVAGDHRLYRKFFIGPDSEKFFQEIISLGYPLSDHLLRLAPIIHNNNLLRLAPIITKSFLNVVSETLATSYYPFVTEKFLYSVVNRGLFVAYAQPGWHDHLEQYHGFRRYDKIFDYRFDSIQNPVERLIELMCMISKFSKLSPDDWQDLYEIEKDTIEHNYHWYFSGHHLKKLQQLGSD